jgi:hypothetical protein
MGGGTDNPFGNPDCAPLPVTMVDAALGAQRGAIRDSDFPPTVTAAAAPAIAATALQPMVDAMVAMGVATRCRRPMCGNQASAPSGAYDALPPVWAQMARVGIKHSRRILEAASREEPADREVSILPAGRPVISPELARAVVGLQFCNVLHDMEDCLSIFAVSYPDQASVAAANARIGLYDQSTSGAALPSWGDLLDSSKSRSLKLPTDWFQLRLVFIAYHRYLQILLGEQHAVPLGMLHLFEEAAANYLYGAMDGAKSCTELMFAVDVYTGSWAEQQDKSDAPVKPEYEDLAKELRLRKWKPPALPAKLLAALKPAAGAVGGNRRGAAPVIVPMAVGLAVMNSDRKPGVYDGTISVNRLVTVKTPSNLPSGPMPCLYYHVGGKCTRNPCPYSESHRKLTAANVAAYVAEHGPAAKAKA